MRVQTFWLISLAAFIVMGAALSEWTDALKETALVETRALLTKLESISMVTWKSGGLDVFVYRRDYAGEAEWYSAVDSALIKWPKDP